MQDVTCGIKTILRPELLRRLLDSIYAYYPSMRCVIVDDGRTPSLPAAYKVDPRITYIRMPYDTGLGACRNVMIDAVETPYCVYLDDDFIFSPATNLHAMQGILYQDAADLIGGQYREGGRYRLYHGLLEIKDGTLYYRRKTRGHKDVVVGGITYPLQYVDLVLNFFMARTDLLKQVKWDPELKINTHTEFFLRACKVMRIAFCPLFAVLHKPARPPGYSELRTRKFRMVGMKKHGVTKVQYTGGVWR